MDYTSIHIYGHLLSDDTLHNIERDNMLIGNRDQDFGMDISVSSAIDYVWSSLRNDWNFYKERANNERFVNKDPYGTRRARDLMERLFQIPWTSVPSTIVPKAVCARSRLMPPCSNISTPRRMCMASSATDNFCVSYATPDSW